MDLGNLILKEVFNMKKLLITIVSALMIIFTLTGCDGKVSNKDLQKKIESSSDFSSLMSSSAKILTETEIGGGKKALLFSAKISEASAPSYYIATTDAKGKSIYALRYSYEPLEVILDEISHNRPENMNNALYKKIVDHFSSYGDSYLTDETNAKTFLHDITGPGGVISTQVAQDLITEHIKNDSIYNDEDELWVVFEEESAVPLCYAIKTKSSYNPDDNSENMWVAYTLSGDQDGTYKTKAELYEAVTGKYAEFTEDEATEGTLRLAVVANKEPFVYSIGSTPSGADIDIANAIAKELNMDIEVAVLSQGSAISSTGNGTYDMAMGGLTTSVSGNNITFTDNYYGDYVIILGSNGTLNNKICAALSKIKSEGTAKEIMERHNVHNLPKEEIQEEPKETPPAKKDEPKQEETVPDSGQNTTISYRVRKSADDSKSQLGAFASLENAKKEANAHKDDGYKVYDMKGKLIYTP